MVPLLLIVIIMTIIIALPAPTSKPIHLYGPASTLGISFTFSHTDKSCHIRQEAHLLCGVLILHVKQAYLLVPSLFPSNMIENSI